MRHGLSEPAAQARVRPDPLLARRARIPIATFEARMPRDPLVDFMPMVKKTDAGSIIRGPRRVR